MSINLSSRPFVLRAAALAFASCALPATLSAATIGHWRFEEGAFLEDSSGNGLNLTAVNTPQGAPSVFLDPIPLTGASNSQMADVRTGHFSVTDGGAFSITSAFTIEMFIHQTSRGAEHSTLAGQNVGGLSGGRGWILGLAGTTATSFGAMNGELYLQISSNGSAFSNYRLPGLALSLETDYYVALSYDATSPTGGISLLVQNLETNETFLETFNHNGGSVFDTGSALRLGDNFTGYMDEVRLSDTALSPSDLLIIPEPSTTMLAGGLALLLTGVRRRQRCA